MLCGPPLDRSPGSGCARIGRARFHRPSFSRRRCPAAWPAAIRSIRLRYRAPLPPAPNRSCARCVLKSAWKRTPRCPACAQLAARPRYLYRAGGQGGDAGPSRPHRHRAARRRVHKCRCRPAWRGPAACLARSRRGLVRAPSPQPSRFAPRSTAFARRPSRRAKAAGCRQAARGALALFQSAYRHRPACHPRAAAPCAPSARRWQSLLAAYCA